jgi:hypothetical protein
MAIPNETRGARVTVYFLARSFIALLGLSAVAWGGFAFPLFWQEVSPDRIAAGLVRGDAFKLQVLLDAAQQAEATERNLFCNPTESHNVVVLRLAILNEAIASTNQSLVESTYSPLYDVTRRALSCVPADSFVWLTLFWLDTSKHGFNPDNANYLRLSYTLGPNEGWIALWRSRIAFALFERLPTDLSDDAIDEFIRLVDTGQLYSETVAIFARAPPAGQSRIVERLKAANPISRQIFARAVHDRGIDVNIPGTSIPELPPWQR